ncbi:MAG: D-cysteine desulfhydrase [Cellvibrionaceae bacterium]|jgi:D-cysteine desulfhydrase
MPLHWPEKLALAQLPTPLQSLDRLSNRLGGPKIWVKRDDLTGSTLGGNKVRKLEFTVALAQSKGADLLITCGGVQSNHCRATAFVGARLGMPVHLVLRGDPGPLDGNLLLASLAGAHVHCYPATQYQQQLNQLLSSWVDHYRRQGYSPHIIPTGASDAAGLWGYFHAALEIKRDCQAIGLQPDMIVTATGSGGTQAGLTLGSYYFGLGASVLGMAVCDDEDYFQRKVSGDIKSFTSEFSKYFKFSDDLESLAERISIHTNDRYIGEGYGVASEAVMETIAMVAREEDLLLDPVYTGKAFHGLLSEIQEGNLSHLKHIIFVHTGGVFSLFPYRKQLQKLLGSNHFYSGSDHEN